MSVKTSINKAYKIAGSKVKLAAVLGVAYQTIDEWRSRNEMPATEYNGKTFYSTRIQDLTNGKVTVADLCGFVPHPQDPDWPGFKAA